MDDIEIIEGFYKNSLTNELKSNLNLKKAAIVMIDCDFYNSAKLVLNFITDLINDGTILIFDDWYAYKGDPNKGEQKACSEWLEKNKNIKLIPYKSSGTHQKSFIVNIISN